MKVLVCTALFHEWTGSEIVALETVEHFRGEGHDVVVAAETAGSPLSQVAAALGCDVVDPVGLDPEPFDLIWAQHHVLVGVVGRALRDRESVSLPLAASVHLSPYEPLECPLLSFTELIGAELWANSIETAERIESRSGSLRAPVRVFHNAAPAPFWAEPRERAVPLRRLLVVSNHPPPELLDAVALLEREHGVEVRRLGMDAEFRRLTPEDLAWADGVVSIGKTAVHALAAKCPAYIYDRFGGDGWLSAERLAFESENNFSGRPRRRTLAADMLAREIFHGHPEAVAFSNSPLPPDFAARFRLAPMLDALAARARSDGRRTVTRGDWRTSGLDGAAEMATILGRFMRHRYAGKRMAKIPLEPPTPSSPLRRLGRLTQALGRRGRSERGSHA